MSTHVLRLRFWSDLVWTCIYIYFFFKSYLIPFIHPLFCQSRRAAIGQTSGGQSRLNCFVNGAYGGRWPRSPSCSRRPRPGGDDDDALCAVSHAPPTTNRSLAPERSATSVFDRWVFPKQKQKRHTFIFIQTFFYVCFCVFCFFCCPAGVTDNFRGN